MTTYNSSIDKDGLFGRAVAPLLGDGIVFSSYSEDYKQKRKHCAHAFYKNHMNDMQENLKRIMVQTFTEWLAEMEKSESQTTVKDINQVFNEMFSKNIITIACGDNEIYKHEVELEVPKHEGSSEYIVKKYRITKALHKLVGDLTNQLGPRQLNPINSLWKYTNKLYPMGKD